MVTMDCGQCRIIMRNGVLLPGMAMPAIGPPPSDPHPNPAVQRLREAWNLNIIAWEGVFNLRRPVVAVRRLLPGRWIDPNALRRSPMPMDQSDDDAAVEDC